MYNNNPFSSFDPLTVAIRLSLFENTNLLRYENQAKQAIELLTTGIENQFVHNSDYQSAKKVITTYMEKLDRAIYDKHYLSIPMQQRDQAGLSSKISDAYYHQPNASNYAKTEKLYNLVKKLIPSASNDVDRALEFYSKASELLNQAKPLIVKGRKPSENPRQTPVRTLENTGTCGICGQNVKMKPSGILYDHGFKLKFRFRSGNCFGSNRKPIEVSKQPVIDYINVLENTRTDSVKKLQSPDITPAKKREHKQAIAYFDKVIPMYEKIADQWKPGQLPGALSKIDNTA